MRYVLRFIVFRHKLYMINWFQRSDADGSSHEDFARRRLQLADCLYFKTLERVMLSERRRLSALSGGDPVDLSVSAPPRR